MILKKKTIFIVFILSMFSCIYLLSQIYISKTVYDKYRSLVRLFPMYSQGRDFGVKETISSLQPMTYGLLLSAESLAYSKCHYSEDKVRSEEAVSWLLGKYEDQITKGYTGWGLPQAWDAFGDGTINPSDYPYSITTAIVLQGFLDYLMTFPGSRFNTDIERVLKETILYWCNNLFFCITDGAGYFSYSPFEGDKYFCSNVSSMVCGVFQRALHDYKYLFSKEEHVAIQNAVDKAAIGIVANVNYINGLPFWSYTTYKREEQEVIKKSVNDLVHHGLTLWGIEEYRKYGGKIAIPWSSREAVSSLDFFWQGDLLMNYELSQKKKLPAKLWGIGMAIAFYSREKEVEKAKNCLELLENNYGFPYLLIYPRNYARRRGMPNSRHNSYVLFGIGYLINAISQ